MKRDSLMDKTQEDNVPQTRDLTPVEKRALNEDLHFLTEMSIHNADGKRYLGTEKRAFNIGWRLSESQFVREWLIQFALGNDSGINYFNGNLWVEETNKGRLCVEVYADNNPDKTVLIIPPIIATSLNINDYAVIRKAVEIMNSNIADENKTMNPDSNLPVARELAKYLNGKRTTLTDMVPEHFYKKHGVVPLVEKQCFFIRDVINADKELDVDDLYKLREILYRKHSEEVISVKDREFCDGLSRGNIQWEKVKENDNTNNSNEEKDEDDPLSC